MADRNRTVLVSHLVLPKKMAFEAYQIRKSTSAMKWHSTPLQAASFHQILWDFDVVCLNAPYYVEDGEHHAAWHEIELSRRSTSGTKKLAHLVHTLIEKRYLTHDNQEHNINLVMHCATAKIERENHRVIRTALADCCALNKNMNLQEAEEEHQSPAFALQISSDNGPVRWFIVYINVLPASVELTWGSELPWPGAPGTVSSDIDVFRSPVTT